MKLIKWQKEMLTLGPGVFFSADEDSITLSTACHTWIIRPGALGAILFEAIYDFMAGREVIFDVDKFLDLKRRKEATK